MHKNERMEEINNTVTVIEVTGKTVWCRNPSSSWVGRKGA